MNSVTMTGNYEEIARLVGVLAHEIKNPLSTILLNMELLAEDLGVDPENPLFRRASKRVLTVQRECERLRQLLEDFLNFTRVRTLNIESVDINALIREIVDFYRPRAEEAGIEILLFPVSNLPTVRIDREMFRGALWNLILNAEQAMPNGGQLVIATSITTSGIALELIDTGCGIDEAIRSKIFETFYSTKRDGTGLGLPMTRRIVEAFHGHIFVESEPGKGTKFTIELPTPPRIA
ncbi:MAG: ATP-binding protein [Thermoguttaceae bacterium]|nr:ATP-binding protein [Thermoguttaceae bacterium]